MLIASEREIVVVCRESLIDVRYKETRKVQQLAILISGMQRMASPTCSRCSVTQLT